MGGAWIAGGVGLLAAVAVVALIAPSASADTASVEAELPQGLKNPSSVWTGEAVYVFGGLNRTGGSSDFSDEIVRYEPDTGNATVMDARLPWTGSSATAVWDDRSRPEAGCPEGCAYVFWTDTVTRYDPSTDTVEEMNATLPNDPIDATTVWTGDRAYIFGGRDAFTPLDQILRYDPVNDTVTKLEESFPGPRERMASVWTGEEAYLFGGTGCPGECDDIWRFDPDTDTLQLQDVKLNVSLRAPSAVWDGHHAFVLGGINDGVSKASILRVDPGEEEIRFMDSRLPTGRDQATAVWTGRQAILLGGSQAFERGDLAEIVHYSLEPNAPRDLDVEPVREGDAFSTEVTWDPPKPTSYSVLTGYVVERRSNATFEAPSPWQPVAHLDPSVTSWRTSFELTGDDEYRVYGVNDHRDNGTRSSSEAAVDQATVERALFDPLPRLLGIGPEDVPGGEGREE